GFLEASNAAGEEFGAERFKKEIEKHGKEPLETICPAIQESVAARSAVRRPIAFVDSAGLGGNPLSSPGRYSPWPCFCCDADWRWSSSITVTPSYLETRRASWKRFRPSACRRTSCMWPGPLSFLAAWPSLLGCLRRSPGCSCCWTWAQRCGS